MKKYIYNLDKLLFLITLRSRINTLKLLGGKSIKEKLQFARTAYYDIFYSKILEDYLISTFNYEKKTLSWESFLDDITNCFDNSDELNDEKIQDFNEKISHDIYYFLNKTENLIGEVNEMFESIDFIIDFLKKNLDIEKKIILNKPYCENFKWGKKTPKKYLQTPSIIKLDKIFDPTISVLEKSQIKFSKESFDNNVEFFWNLSIREILASEICAMSIFEYDNLPIDFYYDMTKQMWDEARHSSYYLNKSIKYFKLVEEKSNDKRLLKIVKDYKNGGKLPIPREKNFMEAFLNSTLTERLVLLNIRTEAPAVTRLLDKMNSPFCEDFPDIKLSFSIDRNDEISHGSIGYKWFKFLYPDKEKRKKVLEQVDDIRGFLLTTAIAENNDGDFFKTILDLTQ